MLTGIASSLVLPLLLPDVHPINTFPMILAISLVGCLIATYVTKPEDDEVLKEFYRRVRPWGFWRPVLEKVLKEDPTFCRNKAFKRDMFNIVVGTVWQCCFILLAMYLVTRSFGNALITLAVGVVTSLILKKNWYDRLPRSESAPAPESREVVAEAVVR